VSDTAVAVRLQHSGTPTYEGVPQSASWSAAHSTLLSSLTGSVFGAAPARPTETVYLTREQQRIMGRALRRSLRIIA
jgi:hypothetical protein